MNALMALALAASLATAQETKVELKGTGWVNSKDMTLDRLHGKIVVLYFFEINWPTCRSEIPVRNRMRKEYADKPVAFIAISSGNSRSDIAGYAKETKFDWPILVDEHRETESQFGFKISLQNIMQWVMFDPDGKRVQGNILEEVQALTPKATWIFEGITVPEKLKATAHDIEFGMYDPAIGDLATVAQKGSKDLQEPARAMFDKVKGMATQGLEKAKSLETDGRKYAAYAEYARIAAWFRRTEFEKPASAAMAELKKDKEVQEEVAAKLLLDQAKGLLASSKKSDRESAPALLALLMKKYPNTEAAKEAGKLK